MSCLSKQRVTGSCIKGSSFGEVDVFEESCSLVALCRSDPSDKFKLVYNHGSATGYRRILLEWIDKVKNAGYDDMIIYTTQDVRGVIPKATVDVSFPPDAPGLGASFCGKSPVPHGSLSANRRIKCTDTTEVIFSYRRFYGPRYMGIQVKFPLYCRSRGCSLIDTRHELDFGYVFGKRCTIVSGRSCPDEIL